MKSMQRSEEKVTVAIDLATENKPKRSTRKKSFPWIYIILRHPQARIGIAIILFLVAMAVFAPLIAPGDPTEYIGGIN